MSTSTPGFGVPHGDAPRPTGWLLFAGTMIGFIGLINLVYGTAAIGGSKFYFHRAAYITGDLETWGWALLALGALQVGAALAIWIGAQWGRWFGVVSASANAVLQLLAMPSYPLLALTVFALDVLVVYGLVARMPRAASAGT